MPFLQVRPMRKEDISSVVRYFTDANEELLSRMGVDAEQLPSKETFTAQLETLLSQTDEEARVSYLIWYVDRKAVGFSSLKNIEFGARGEMHLHMWDTEKRGKGLGGVLFCLSALNFYERFRLKKIICEPRESNPLPNRMLQKAGFPLVAKRFGKSSEISAATELNTYEIRREIAQDCIVLNLGQLQLD